MKDEQESQLIGCLDLKHFVGVVREVRFAKHNKYKHKFRVLLLASLFTDCLFPDFDDHLRNKVQAEKNKMNYTSTLTCPKTSGNGSGKQVRWAVQQCAQ